MPYCRNCGSHLYKEDHYCETCGKKIKSSSVDAHHIGKTCPYCQFPIKQDSKAVQCPSCKVPHHRDCWEENRGCTTFGCHETIYRPVEGERPKVLFDDTLGQQAAAAYEVGTYKMLAGYMHSLALKDDGTVWAWGKNEYGRLGDGTTEHRYSPAQVAVK